MVSVVASVVIVIPVPAVSVRVSVAESATTLDCPATAIVAKLSEARPPPETVAHVLSPLRKVVASLVPAVPSLATGTVPLPKFVALRAVKLTPLAAGNVAGNLASGTVPLPKFVALRAVKLTPLAAGNVAGNLASGIVPLLKFVAFNAVRLVPDPLNAVADSVPTSLIDARLVCIEVPDVPLYRTKALSV